MKTELTVCLIFLLVGWMFLAGKNYSAEVKRKLDRVPISSLAPAPENYIPPVTPTKYPVNGIKYSGNCADIDPEAGIEIEHTQIGTTWYDFQQNGSMGRMISVTNQGYRHFSWMYTNGVYPGNPRYVRTNSEDSTNGYVGATNADGGSTNAGYCNQTHLQDGTSILIYHRTAVTPIWYTSITAANSLGSSLFDRHWDIPDCITSAPSGQPGMWPRADVKYDTATGRDYIQVVMTEGNTAAGIPVMLAYERCYIKDGPDLLDTMICQSFQGDSTQTYKVVAGANGGGPFSPISHFDSSCGINSVVAVSPVSSRLTIVYLKPACDGSCSYFSDVCYIESMVNGDDWISGSPWPAPESNVTNYGCTGNERGFSDLSACYDYQDSLHIVYVTTGFDPSEPGYYYPGVARLYHWSKKSGTSLIASNIQPGVNPGQYNLIIAKPSISADNPLFHPTGDTVYLFCIFTRFDTTDVAANGFGNGDIFVTGSNNGGASWGGKFNLTNTQTDNCAPGNCLSEHWSSMAQNTYGGDLHIQYICDKDAGGAIQDSPSAWMENPVMYLRLLTYFPPPPPDARWRIISPPQWHSPPLKVTPNGSVNLIFRIYNMGNANLIYAVNSDNSCIQVNIPPSGLPPGDSVTITAVLSGSGSCNNSYISGNVIISTNDPINPTIELLVQAVVANDYFECPRDPSTNDTLDNGILQMYVNANGQEWIHDIGSFPDTVHDVFFNGGLFVATTQNSDTLVGRYYGDNDHHTFAREQLYLNSMYNDFWLEYSWNVAIHKLNPPVETKWWWFDILHENVFFKPTASDDLKHCVIKFVTVERHDPPSWWPSQPTFTGFEDTYIGVMMDMDAPWDTLGSQNGRNRAGYDANNNIAYQRGWDYTGAHSSYNDYYAGIALAQGWQNYENTVPRGTYNLRNDVYLYPQSPWGWKDGDFYRLAAGNTLGAIQDPDSTVDRSQILTARKITAGTNAYLKHSFTVIEAVGTTGLADLQNNVAVTRAWVAAKPIILCGDMNNDGIITISEVVLLINYLFKGAPASIFAQPMGRANVTYSVGDLNITVSDIVLLLGYLFKGTPASTLKCPGIW